MDSVTSSEFQKAYTHLEQPTEVTVHGVVIGVWTPARHISPVKIAIKTDTTRHADKVKK